jgi:hypothetical protein
VLDSTLQADLRCSEVISYRPILLSVFKAVLLYSLCCAQVPMLQLSAQTTTAPPVSKEQWHEDLTFLAAELPKRHANAFHFLPKATFVQEVSQLDQTLDDLNRDEIFSGDENLIRPDREIAETWADFQAGRDPVMEWVLRTVSDAHD